MGVGGTVNSALALVPSAYSALSCQRDPVKTPSCAPRMSLLCSEPSLDTPALSGKESMIPVDHKALQDPVSISLWSHLLLLSLQITLASSQLLESARHDLVSGFWVCCFYAQNDLPQMATCLPSPTSLGSRVQRHLLSPPQPLCLKCEHPNSFLCFFPTVLLQSLT